MGKQVSARRIALAAFFSAMVACGIPVANAQQNVGEAKRVVNTVTGAGAVGQRRLDTNDPVYRSESISAEPDSRGELELVDGSRVIVGEGSTVSLDDFVVSDGSITRGTINVTKGAFRFISGSSKEKIQVRTPLSTIGIRGTTFDVYVDEDGVTQIVLLNGQITACSGGSCVNVTLACSTVEVGAGGSIQELPFLFSNALTPQQQAAMFGLTSNQARHSPGWQALLVPCLGRAAAQATSQTGGTTADHEGGSPGASPSPGGSYD